MTACAREKSPALDFWSCPSQDAQKWIWGGCANGRMPAKQPRMSCCIRHDLVNSMVMFLER